MFCSFELEKMAVTRRRPPPALLALSLLLTVNGSEGKVPVVSAVLSMVLVSCFCCLKAAFEAEAETDDDCCTVELLYDGCCCCCC